MTNNLRGQIYQVFDPAGLLQSNTFDFKGNLLESFRQYAKEYKATPDWAVLPAAPDINAAAVPLLENETFTQQMAYDALNRPTAMTMPDDSVVRPTYNEANLLETVEANLRGSGTATPFVTNIDYNARGQREKIVYGNGSQTRYTYDPDTFRLTRLLTTRNTGADILQDLNYIFDAAGNITEQIDNAQQTVFFNNTQVDPHGKYTYDALYRLIEAEGRELIGLNAAPGPGDININPLPENTQALRRYAQQYEYDEIGNILKVIHQATGGNWTRHYHYNFTQNNYLLSTSPDNNPPTTDQYTYDAHGSMLSMPHLTSMDWDFADRLQVADLGGGGMAYYVYDAGGERIRKVIERNGGVKEERFYLGGWEVYRKSQGGTLELERETLHMMDDERRIVLVDSLTVDNASVLTSPTQLIRYQLDNHLNSAGLELDETAAVISYEEYYSFGTTSYRSGRSNAEVALKRYRYVGKERDDETGLYYYGARYYAGWLARFVSVDPLKDEYAYYTPYQYAGNKPIISLDLDGLESTAKVGQQAENTLIYEEVGDFTTRVTDPETGKSQLVERETIELQEVVVEPKKSFFQRAGEFLYENVVKNIPVVGGIFNAVESFAEGDILGGFLGIGEALLDAVLLVTTGGLGNLAKAGLKIGAKQGAKLLLKETGENLVGQKVGEAASDQGIPLWAQIAGGILLGVRPKKKNTISGIIGEGQESLDDASRATKQGIKRLAVGLNQKIQVNLKTFLYLDMKGNWMV